MQVDALLNPAPHRVKPGHITLLTVTLASLVIGGYAKPPRPATQVFKFDLPAVPVTFPAVVFPAVTVRPSSEGGLCGGSQSRSFMMCGGSFMLPINPRPESMLPDPIAAMGAAYLKCRLIKAAMLDPEVPVEFYPAGHFGRWVQDGVLVTDRIVVTDETELRRLFTLLIETMGEPDDLFDECWPEDPGSWASVGDFRRQAKFAPEMIFEFVGESPLRIEICLWQKRVLMQMGERWEIYALDRWSAGALRDFLKAKSRQEAVR